METKYWTFPALSAVWEYRNGAIVAGGRQLDALSGDERERAWVELRDRVQGMVEGLDDGWLLTTAFRMVEDIYKSFFRGFEWDSGVHDYLTATGQPVIAELARRGFVLHYVIDATEGDADIALTLEYLPQIFQAAGLAVVGPQMAALRFFIAEEGEPPADIRAIQRYRHDGHAIADSVISGWHQERQSSVYLNFDFDDGLPGLPLNVALSQWEKPGTAVVLRRLAPAESTEAYFVPPSGVAMPPGVAQCPPPG